MQKTTKFTREELRLIRDTALKEASHYSNINHIWKLAYLKLADAADHLDAMLARSEESLGLGELSQDDQATLSLSSDELLKIPDTI